jgi:predicted nucleotidyltransferase component of viral defense system
LRTDTVAMDSYERIKRTAIAALFSDDELMDRLVLKGGNAIDLAYEIRARASLDLDFSMAGEFDGDTLPETRDRLERCLADTFALDGLHVFDVRFKQVPQVVSPEAADFWGGYTLEFKVIEQDKVRRLGGALEALRRNAMVVNPGQHRTFRIEISKFEFCGRKREFDLQDYRIYAYTPEVIVIEKLRAICQQMSDYRAVVRNRTPAPRAKDFFDIYTVVERFEIDLTQDANLRLVERVFAAKRVPLHLLGRIQDYREFHRQDFPAVENTVRNTGELKSFDFYFDYVVELARRLHVLWYE